MSTPEIFTETVARSHALPAAWRAQHGQTTPNGNVAVLRSNAHAAMAIRLLFLDHSGEGSAERLSAIVALHERGEIGQAAAAWNQVDQHHVNAAYRTHGLKMQADHQSRGRSDHASRVANHSTADGDRYQRYREAKLPLEEFVAPNDLIARAYGEALS